MGSPRLLASPCSRVTPAGRAAAIRTGLVEGDRHAAETGHWWQLTGSLAAAVGAASDRIPQAAGPLARTTVADCAWPAWSVQPILTLSPGWRSSRADWSADGDETG
jgi:hypothetical protein